MTTKETCPGTGQRVVYRPGEVHPHCSVCDADLSGNGKRYGTRTVGALDDKGRYGIFARRHMREVAR